MNKMDIPFAPHLLLLAMGSSMIKEAVILVLKYNE